MIHQTYSERPKNSNLSAAATAGEEQNESVAAGETAGSAALPTSPTAFEHEPISNCTAARRIHLSLAYEISPRTTACRRRQLRQRISFAGIPVLNCMSVSNSNASCRAAAIHQLIVHRPKSLTQDQSILRTGPPQPVSRPIYRSTKSQKHRSVSRR